MEMKILKLNSTNLPRNSIKVILNIHKPQYNYSGSEYLTTICIIWFNEVMLQLNRSFSFCLIFYLRNQN